MHLGRYTFGAMLIVVAAWVLMPSAISQRKRITKEQLIRSCKPGRRERKPAASYIVMLQKHGVDFSPTVEDEVDIRAACRYLGEKELAELIAAIRYQYRLQEVLAEAQAFLSPSPSPSPSPTPTPKPDWKRSDEAKQLVAEMVSDVQKLADEGRVIDLTDFQGAVKTYNNLVEKVSVTLGRIDIQMRRFGKDTDYQGDWNRYDKTFTTGLLDPPRDKELFRNKVMIVIYRLDAIASSIKIDTAPDFRDLLKQP